MEALHGTDLKTFFKDLINDLASEAALNSMRLYEAKTAVIENSWIASSILD